MASFASSLRRVRFSLALVLALSLLLAAAPTIGAQEAEPDEPRFFQSTDPSAEEALGRLEARHLEGLDLDTGAAGLSAFSLDTQSVEALAEPDEVVVEGGVTQPVFSYADAIRETVQIPGVVGSEDSGETDVINVDIIRPAASEGDLDVPTIIVPSPYYAGPGRGRAGEAKPAVADQGVNVGGTDFDGNLLTSANPLAGQSGPLVSCGLAQTAADCGGAAPGFIALIERGTFTFNQKAASAQAAGAVGAVIYNNVGGTFSANITGVSIPVLGVTRADGQAMLPFVGSTATLFSEPRDGIDFFPLYYDNYFVPRGYAVALLDLAGTRGSTGCLDIGGPAEIDNTVEFVKWLTGDAVGYDIDGNAVTADWSNGLSGMVGKSWDGTVANGVASRGVDGLATIVPIAGISGWYHWYWQNGARFTGHSPLSLANAIRNVPASRCTNVNAELSAGNTLDPTTDFWVTRDFIKDADKVKASVFFVHGLNDYNVKPLNYGYWFDALAEHDVPMKIWLSQVAHEKAFDFRRDEWLDTIHRWFDHWLQEIDNGIMDEPMADVEYAPDQWATYDTWPGGSEATLRFGQPEDEDDPRQGVLGLGNLNPNPRSMTFTELRRSHDSAAQNPFDEQDTRLVFMTDELTEAVRVSGTPKVSLRATIDGSNAHLGAYLVDYGTATRTNWRTGGGILDLNTVSCFGEGTAIDTGCYRDVERRTRTRDFEVVTRGWANAQFVAGETSFDPEESYRLEWDIQTNDYVFEAGHRIGIVITGVDSTAIANHGTNGTPIEVHLNGSHIHLPVVGGAKALRDATD